MSSAAKHLLLDTETILLHATLWQKPQERSELSFPTAEEKRSEQRPVRWRQLQLGGGRETCTCILWGV